MGVYIKGMEIPNSCRECPFYAGNGCRATHTLFDPMTNVGTRVCGCPLTEVSEPHGRLIDASSIEKEFEKRSYALVDVINTRDRGIFLNGAKQIIREASTVIERSR